MIVDAPLMYRSSSLHASMLNVIDLVLQQHQPSNVQAEEIVVTGEGEAVCIVLIPHHQLGGVALLVWSDVRGVQLCWGRVTSLRRHDEIDLAVRARHPIAPDDVDAVADAISVEMVRPIKAQLRPRRFAGPTVECSLEIDGEAKVIGRFPFSDRIRFAGVLTTTLAGGALPFEVSVPIAELRRSA